jgi:hypothetical protein
LDAFKSAATEWLCDEYAIEVRYIGKREDNVDKLLSCAINFNPVKFVDCANLSFKAHTIFAGKVQLNNVSIENLREHVKNIELGQLIIESTNLSILASGGLSFKSEILTQDRWVCDAHLNISGDFYHLSDFAELTKINHELRQLKHPFDGLNDLISFLNLPDPTTKDKSKNANMEISILPPIDIVINNSKLSDGKFTLTLHAHPKFNTNNITLAVREIPENLSSRKQVAKEITWDLNTSENVNVGNLCIQAPNSFVVQQEKMLLDVIFLMTPQKPQIGG